MDVLVACPGILTGDSPYLHKGPLGHSVQGHNAQGHYVGTEPEREWDEEEIMEKYGQYQEMPLRSVLGRTTPYDTPLALPWGA